ncbi:MAG TPA: FliH/SctL family protein [Planctomycetota bacterium]|nr:FliH/SctL family protein [Planctomycetota bacterium]
MSRERLSLPAGVVAFRAAPARPGSVATPDGAGASGAAAPAAPQTAAPAAGVTAPELKEMQRRAFERGVAFARHKFAERLDAALAAVDASRRELEASRAAERPAVAAFAVELAVGLAEEMTGCTLRAGRHDVRAAVEAAVAEALPTAAGAPLIAHLNPEDLAELEQAVAVRPLQAAADATLRGDPTLRRGACRVTCGGAELLCDPHDRLRAAAARLRQAAAQIFAEASGDAL